MPTMTWRTSAWPKGLSPGAGVVWGILSRPGASATAVSACGSLMGLFGRERRVFVAGTFMRGGGRATAQRPLLDEGHGDERNREAGAGGGENPGKHRCEVGRRGPRRHRDMRQPIKRHEAARGADLAEHDGAK